MKHAQNRFVILGSSSGAPQPQRCTSGYVLDIDGRLSLVDCGGGVSSSFLRRGLDPLAVDSVFISHCHPDHVCELPLVLQMLYLAGRQQEVTLYLPEEFVGPFRAYLNAVYMIPEKLPFEIHITGYGDGFTVSDPCRLRAIANNHLQGYADVIAQLGLPNRMQSHCFRIETADRRLLYSADIGGLEDIRVHLDGNDYVVMETTHVDLDAFFVLAPTVNVGEFVITHLGDDESILELNRKARKAGLDNITTAVDGMELRL